MISSHYLELKAHMSRKEAIVHALNAAIPLLRRKKNSRPAKETEEF